MHYLFIKYFWLLVLVTNVINTIILRKKATRNSNYDPEIELGYNKAIRIFVVFTNIPWIIMGIGQTFNLTENIFDYLRPRELNPIVIAFYISILLIILLYGYWIFIKDGAKSLLNHRQLIGNNYIAPNIVITEQLIKVFSALMILSAIIAMVAFWVIDFPLINI